jgi:hypothetical protein
MLRECAQLRNSFAHGGHRDNPHRLSPRVVRAAALLLVAAVAQPDRTRLRGGSGSFHGCSRADVRAVDVLGAASDATSRATTAMMVI